MNNYPPRHAAGAPACVRLVSQPGAHGRTLRASAAALAPVRWESTLSYLTRLAAAHHWELPELLAQLGIRVGYRARLQAEGEIYLSPGAQATVASLTGIPQQRLRRLLPAWTHTPPNTRWSEESAATAMRVPFRLTAQGCPRCLAARVHGLRPALYLPFHHLLCRAHGVWSLGKHTLAGQPVPYAHADVRALAEVAAASRAYRRLLRRHPGDAVARAFSRAYSAVGYWWLDHGSSDAVWRARAQSLAHGPVNAEMWRVLAQAVLMYPETVNLTRLLIRHHYGEPTLPGEDPRARQRLFEDSVLARCARPWLTRRYLIRSSNIIFLSPGMSGGRRPCRHPIHQRVPRDLDVPELQVLGYEGRPAKGAHSVLWSAYSHRLEQCQNERSPWMRR